MNRRYVLGIAAFITLLGALFIAVLQQQVLYGALDNQRGDKAPVVFSGQNAYVVWSTNKTGNDEVMFRSSTDGGATFADKINLSNTPGADSQDADIASVGVNVIVTWWERNQTSGIPVARTSADNGATFGPMLVLAANGAVGESAEE